MNLERGVKVGIKLKPGTFPKHIREGVKKKTVKKRSG